MTDCVLIIDEDAASEAALRLPLKAAGLRVEVTRHTLVAIERLKTEEHRAVVLDPMIRHRLNGYAVLAYIEQERPQIAERVFLWTVLPKQTILRIAPSFVSRLYRKSTGTSALIEALAATVQRPPDRPARIAKSVLVVEDDETTARMTCDVLQELGYTCEWAPNGERALSAIEANPCDAILLDLVMPDMDGFTLLQYIRDHRPELVRRVVVISGVPANYLEDLQQHSLCAVLQKPIDFDALQRVLNRCGDMVPPEGGGEVPAMN